jgi:hypothetical protein
MNKAMVNQLRAAFAGAKRCTPEHFAKMKKTLSVLPDKHLHTLRDARIPFVSTAANSLLVDRGSLPKSARWDWAIEVVVDGIIETNAPQLATA